MPESTATAQVATPAVITRDTCRLCQETALEKVWSFGPTPLANSYLLPEEVGQPEVMAPLDVYYCSDCHLVQLRDVVAPDLLFKHYLYVSSTSPSFVKHFEEYAQTLINRFHLNSDDLVVDVGSNDGVLLKPLQTAGVNVLGVDPAENVAEAANTAGIPTKTAYFSADVARDVKAEHGPARVITANNVFAHTDDIDGFVAGVQELLSDDGVFVFEVQYLGDLLEKNLFDIVYHEHVNYYHVTPLTKYFARHGMRVFDVERVAAHGGSIRVYVQREGGPHSMTSQLENILKREQTQGLNDIAAYQDFAQRIEENKQQLRGILDDIKKEGKTVAAFGAPAKATTLMYAFGLTADDIDFIVDDAELKQGRVMPGTHVPIVAADELYEKRPDYCLILAWNFAEPIMQNHERFTNEGGKWIIPVPKPRIL